MAARRQTGRSWKKLSPIGFGWAAKREMRVSRVNGLRPIRREMPMNLSELCVCVRARVHLLCASASASGQFQSGAGRPIYLAERASERASRR